MYEMNVCALFSVKQNSREHGFHHKIIGSHQYLLLGMWCIHLVYN